MPPETGNLIEAVAQRAAGYPYRIWGFGEGMALLGLLRAGELLDHRPWIDLVTDLVAPTLHDRPDPTDHLIPVEVLVELQRLRPALDIRPAVHRFRHAVAPKGEPARTHRPDLAGLSTMAWVDCLHTDVPGLLLADDPDAAAAVLAQGCARFQHPDGLFSHGYDTATGRPNNVPWGRGQGWALHGLLAGHQLPGGLAALRRLVSALARHEVDGHWRTVVDDATAPIEHSVSALIASALLAPTSGPAERAMGERALVAAIRALDADGGLPVSSATPVGDHAEYLDRDIGVFPWGQGPLLLALLHQHSSTHLTNAQRGAAR